MLDKVFGLENITLGTNTLSSIPSRQIRISYHGPYTTRRYTIVILYHVNRRISPCTIVYDRAGLTWAINCEIYRDKIAKIRDFWPFFF